MNKPPDKQKEVCAASFKRVAKQLRVRARAAKSIGDGVGYAALRDVAAELDVEATLLRKMR